VNFFLAINAGKAQKNKILCSESPKKREKTKKKQKKRAANSCSLTCNLKQNYSIKTVHYEYFMPAH